MEPEAGPRNAASAAVPAGGTAEVTSDKKKSLNWLDDQRRRMRQGGFPLAYAQAPPRDTFARASHLLRWLASDPDDAAGYVGISSGGQGLLALLGTEAVPEADQQRYFMGMTQWVFLTDRGLVQSLVPLSVEEKTEDLLKPLLSPPPDLITADEWLLWVNLRLGLRRRTEVDSILQPWLLSRQNQVQQERKNAAMRGLVPATPVGAAALPASARALGAKAAVGQPASAAAVAGNGPPEPQPTRRKRGRPRKNASRSGGVRPPAARRRKLDREPAPPPRRPPQPRFRELDNPEWNPRILRASLRANTSPPIQFRAGTETSSAVTVESRKSVRDSSWRGTLDARQVPLKKHSPSFNKAIATRLPHAFLNVGGAVMCLAWCPLHVNPTSASSGAPQSPLCEHLSVLAKGDQQGAGDVQIWRVPVSPSQQVQQQELPSLAFSVKIPGGNPVSLAWCKESGVPMPSENGRQNGRLGVLAVATMEGRLLILSIPHPDHVAAVCARNKVQVGSDTYVSLELHAVAQFDTPDGAPASSIAWSSPMAAPTTSTATTTNTTSGAQGTNGDEKNATQCVSSPNTFKGGPRVAVGTSQGLVSVWEFERAKAETASASSPATARNAAVRFSTRIFTEYVGERNSPMLSLSFCPVNANVLATGGADGILRICDLRDPFQSIYKRLDSQSRITDVCYLADMALILSCSESSGGLMTVLSIERPVHEISMLSFSEEDIPQCMDVGYWDRAENTRLRVAFGYSSGALDMFEGKIKNPNSDPPQRFSIYAGRGASVRNRVSEAEGPQGSDAGPQQQPVVICAESGSHWMTRHKVWGGSKKTKRKRLNRNAKSKTETYIKALDSYNRIAVRAVAWNQGEGFDGWLASGIGEGLVRLVYAPSV